MNQKQKDLLEQLKDVFSERITPSRVETINSRTYFEFKYSLISNSIIEGLAKMDAFILTAFVNDGTMEITVGVEN